MNYALEQELQVNLWKTILNPIVFPGPLPNLTCIRSIQTTSEAAQSACGHMVARYWFSHTPFIVHEKHNKELMGNASHYSYTSRYGFLTAGVTSPSLHPTSVTDRAPHFLVHVPVSHRYKFV